MKIHYIRHIALLLLLFTPLLSMAQADRSSIRKGNREYRRQNYSAAEVEYRKAVASNNVNPQALYNLGCALMVQNKGEEAVKMFQKAAQYEKSKNRRAMIYHNIGEICQMSKVFDEAVKAYSESLRNNPHDDETRYNLVLCKRQQKKQNNQNNQNNNKDNDKNKNNNKGQDKQQDKNSQNDKDKNKDQNKQQQQQQQQLSKENAEQMLNAAMQEEKQTQERLNKQRQGVSGKRLEKNW